MTTPTTTQAWEDLSLALQHGVNRVLLYGPPGTGKTYFALNKYLANDDDTRTRRAFRVLCAPDMTTADVDGMWRPSRDEWKFGLGSAFRAFQSGDRLILDELDQASGDVLTALLLYCDSDGSAVREHPETGDLVRANKDFQIIATTNAERLSDLPANLLDRFPVRINIDTVNPEALKVLPDNLRPIAYSYSTRTGANRHSIRSFLTLNQLISRGMSPDDATRLVFPKEHHAIREALSVSAIHGVMNREEDPSETPESSVEL